MKRLVALLALCLLAECAAPAPERDASPVATGSAEPRPDLVAAGAVCRIAPNGGPVVADRGIGGTGSPSSAAAEVADRGIGGTGIVGVVTGFASVCVNGLEVAYDDSASVDIGETFATPSVLRAGQVVVIQAEGPPEAMHARTISVRNEVAGRIETVELGSGTLTIAGQPVSVSSGTWGANRFGLGDWVSVSGLRRGDGILVATRLDSAPVGTFSARGQVVRDGDVVRVGKLVLHGSAADGVRAGQFVTVSGVYAAGQGQVSAVNPDVLLPDPASYFGTAVNRLVVQAFVRVAPRAIWLNGIKFSAAPSALEQAGHEGLAIVSLRRGPDGAYAAEGLRFTALQGKPKARARRAASADAGNPPPPPSTSQARSAATTIQASSANAIGSMATAAASVATPSPAIATTGAATPASAIVPAPAPPVPAAVTPQPLTLPPLGTTIEPSGGTDPSKVESIPMSSNGNTGASAPTRVITADKPAPAPKVSQPKLVSGIVASSSSPTISLVTGAVTTAHGTTPAAGAATVGKSVTVIGTSSGKAPAASKGKP